MWEPIQKLRTISTLRCPQDTGFLVFSSDLQKKYITIHYHNKNGYHEEQNICWFVKTIYISETFFPPFWRKTSPLALAENVRPFVPNSSHIFYIFTATPTFGLKRIKPRFWLHLWIFQTTKNQNF